MTMNAPSLISAPSGSPERDAKTTADIAASVETARLSIRRNRSKGDNERISALSGVRQDQISRQLAPAPDGEGLQLRVFLAAVVCLLPAVEIDALKEVIFGGITEYAVTEARIVRFPKDGRQFRLEGI